MATILLKYNRYHYDNHHFGKELVCCHGRKADKNAQIITSGRDHAQIDKLVRPRGPCSGHHHKRPLQRHHSTKWHDIRSCRHYFRNQCDRRLGHLRWFNHLLASSHFEHHMQSLANRWPLQDGYHEYGSKRREIWCGCKIRRS